jgi:hypothetical protein
MHSILFVPCIVCVLLCRVPWLLARRVSVRSRGGGLQARIDYLLRLVLPTPILAISLLL